MDGQVADQAPTGTRTQPSLLGTSSSTASSSSSSLLVGGGGPSPPVILAPTTDAPSPRMRRSAAPSLPLLSPVPALARGPVGHGNKRITRETQLDQWSLMLLAFSLVTATLLTAVLRGTATPSFSSLHPLPLLPPLVPTSSNGGGFAAANAHAHIAAITVAEHPMPSVANWAARSYILDVVRRSIASAPTRNVQVMDSTDWVAWTTDDPAMGLGDRVLGRSTIVQSSNVVVRIPGTIANGTRRSAVLLSAHYDSVPTTKGVGDDALGIGTLLEILRVLVQDVEPLPYTVLLNFNNGEELDLYGAQVLARSPSIWSEVGAFINIDSVCPTGRPLLYRSTSADLVDLYARFAPFPHASVVGQELMSAGLIRSDTDYSVYSRANVTGVDFAFYDRRWVYHTDLDTHSLLQPHSIAHLGSNVLALLAGIAQSASAVTTLNTNTNNPLSSIATPPQPNRAIMFADTLGHSMWAVPYGNLSVVAVVVLVLAVVFPWAWSTTTTRHGSTTEINGMAWWSRVVLTARPVPFRAWLAAAAASATVAVLSLVASVTVVAATLAFQPMAVSGRPMLVLVLAFLAAAAATAGMMAAVRARAQAHCHTAPLHHTSDDREEAAYDADIAMAALGATVHAQRGVYGVWVGIMLPLVAVAGTRTAVLSHWLWYAVAMVAGVMVFDLGMWTVSWVMSSNDGPGDGTTAVGVPMTPTSAGSDVHAPLLLPDDGERSPGSPALDPHHQETERATPFTNLKAAANHLLHSPALRASALFLLSSTFPTAIDLDFSLNYTYGLAFAVQEGLPGLAIAGFFGFLVLPITLCAQPVLVSVDPRTARRVSLWCLLGTLVLAVYLALVAWPFTADAPLKVGFAVSTTRVGVVSEAALNAVVAAAAAGAGDVSAEVVFATNPTPPLPPTVVVVVSGVPAYVDPALLFGGVAPVRPCDDRNVCRFTPTSLAPGLGNGTADVPAMRVTVRSSSASSSALSSPMLLLLEDGAQPAYLVDLHLPVAAHLTCTVSRDAPTLIAPGAAVTVFSSINTKQSNPLPPPPVLSLTAAGAFAVAMSDPTSPPLPITLAVPSHWTSRAWSLTCRAALEDPVWGTQVYRSAVAMRADWVALTAGPGARGGLVVVDTTVHFPAAVTSGSGRWWGLGGGGSDGSGADGAEGGSASGIWSWIFGSK